MLHGQARMVFADAGYRGIERRPDAMPQVRWYVAMRPGKRKALDKSNAADALLDAVEKLKAGVRAKVEHPFRVIKRQFGYVKVRYRGLMKKHPAVDHALCAVQFVDGAQQINGLQGMSAPANRGSALKRARKRPEGDRIS